MSDYRPVDSAPQKIKKHKETMALNMIRSQDILASVALLDHAPFTVGFAAETENVRDYARGKLENKNLDMIVANRVGDNCGFDHDDNTVDVLWPNGQKVFPMMAKTELAQALIELIAERFELMRGGDTPPELSVVSSRD